MKDQIIAAIAAYLEKNCNGYGEFIHFKDYPECWDEHVAAEIAAAIEPVINQNSDWKDAPEWAQWQTVDKNNIITFWDEKPMISDAEYWTAKGTKARRWHEAGESDDWKKSLQQRPK